MAWLTYSRVTRNFIYLFIFFLLFPCIFSHINIFRHTALQLILYLWSLRRSVASNQSYSLAFAWHITHCQHSNLFACICRQFAINLRSICAGDCIELLIQHHTFLRLILLLLRAIWPPLQKHLSRVKYHSCINVWFLYMHIFCTCVSFCICTSVLCNCAQFCQGYYNHSYSSIWILYIL